MKLDGNAALSLNGHRRLVRMVIEQGRSRAEAAMTLKSVSAYALVGADRDGDGPGGAAGDVRVHVGRQAGHVLLRGAAESGQAVVVGFSIPCSSASRRSALSSPARTVLR